MTLATLPPSEIAVVAVRDRFAALRPRLLGRLITADDLDYDEVRRVLNFTVDRRPLAIVRAADADDVAEAVIHARDHALPLAVRSGGHSIAKLSMIDDAI